MPILDNTIVKGDLKVSEEIIENGKKIDKKYGCSLAIENGKLVLKNSAGETLGTTNLPS